jgi:hypothetical protein
VVYPATFSQAQRATVPAALANRIRSIPLLSRWRPSAQQAYLWGLGLGSFTVGLVNGALVISAGVGVVAYRQLVELTPDQWQALRQHIQGALPLPHTIPQQARVLSLLMGTSTYTLTALWQNTHSLLLALVLTGQTALTFFVVVALLRSPSPMPVIPHPRQRAEGHGDDETQEPTALTLEPSQALPMAVTQEATPTEAASPERPIEISPGTPTETATEAGVTDRFDQVLADLVHSDALQRLIAVRQLVRLVSQWPDARDYLGAQVSMQSHLTDCFHVMLAHEPEPIVRSAVREGLTLLRQPSQLAPGPEPLPDMSPLAEADDELAAPPQPLETPRSPRRMAVEYVEYLEI